MKPLTRHCKAYCPNYKHCTRTECHRKLGFYNGGKLTMMTEFESAKWDRVLKERRYREQPETKLNNNTFQRARLV